MKRFFLLRNHAEYFSCDLQRTPRMSAWCFSLIMCSLVTSTNVNFFSFCNFSGSLMEGFFVPFYGHSGFRYKLLRPSFFEPVRHNGKPFWYDLFFYHQLSSPDSTTLAHYTLISYYYDLLHDGRMNDRNKCGREAASPLQSIRWNTWK